MQVPAVLKPLELWTGKQVVSVMIRPSCLCPLLINLDLKEKDYHSEKDMQQMDTRDGYVCIRNSELISGRIGKGLLGGSKGGLFGTLAARYSPAVAGALLALCLFHQELLSQLSRSPSTPAVYSTGCHSRELKWCTESL
jgi:DNA-directed RNA polymerase III subunit RPC1